MKTIGINIDGILRDSFTKFDEQYRKVFIHNPSIIAMNEKDMSMREFTPEELEEIDRKIEEKERELLTLPMDSANFLNHYKFEEKIIEMTADNFIMHEDVVYEEAPQEPQEGRLERRVRSHVGTRLCWTRGLYQGRGRRGSAGSRPQAGPEDRQE